MIKITLTAIIQIRATIAYMLHLLLYVTSVYISLLRNFIQKLHLNDVILMAPFSQNVYARKTKQLTTRIYDTMVISFYDTNISKSNKWTLMVRWYAAPWIKNHLREN